ncbi:MAG: alkaline phosphatase family protein [Gemmatimonadaceae bacterium]
MTVVILLADGVRPDTLHATIESGKVPALARLRDEGAFHRVTSCFPSVTGPAYTPFLLGRFPGPLGLPGLRWFDRERATCTFPDYTRSYVGPQMNRVDQDLDPDAPTIFELCDSSLGSMTPVSRGLTKENKIGRLTAKTAFRAARTHFSGSVAKWLDVDREIAGLVVDHIRREQPEFTFAAMMGVDKTSHSAGQPSPLTDEALQIVDETAARIRADAERDGRWKDMHIWITSDHGHSPVTDHEDLAGLVREWGFRTVAHPWIYKLRPEVAVMVSGNAMAHIYLDLGARERAFWPNVPFRYHAIVELLLERESVDIMILPNEAGATVRSARGDAEVVLKNGTLCYRRTSGDPLGLGQNVCNASMDETFDLTAHTDYPDSIAQIATIARSARSGEIILSAARGWDYRSKYEPIPHVSSHGALHREHMFVPLLTSRQYGGTPRRTTDVMPSALEILGHPIPSGLDGVSFI